MHILAMSEAARQRCGTGSASSWFIHKRFIPEPGNCRKGYAVLKAVTLVAILAVAAVPCARPVGAQMSPTPGPTNPNPAPSPLSKPGVDLVINPTTEECKQGWRPGLKWTQDQFEAFCTQMKTSK